jgi:hypothetical protein
VALAEAVLFLSISVFPQLVELLFFTALSFAALSFPFAASLLFLLASCCMRFCSACQAWLFSSSRAGLGWPFLFFVNSIRKRSGIINIG